VTSEAGHVLVIEDDPDMRGLLVLMLEDKGYSVQSASNGRGALDILRTIRPDLILLDMKMPVMDGWEFARRYRAEFGNPSPIIVMTAAEDPRKRAEEIGASGWLGKPVELDELYGLVQRLVLPPANVTPRPA
jgi:CheY-like chemotaxis protein